MVQRTTQLTFLLHLLATRHVPQGRSHHQGVHDGWNKFETIHWITLKTCTTEVFFLFPIIKYFV